jgi:uncharacterized protein with HEPN domain
MSAPQVKDLIGHMRDAVFQATSYVEGLDKDDFLADRRTQQAVVLNLIILGEAATKLMDRHGELTNANPEIEWRSMRGMRNRIAHGYYEIDLEVVWETISTALPNLAEQLAAIRTA